ncbi:MAG: transcriptional regulator NrdR [Planctomycetaceae bacterium]
MLCPFCREGETKVIDSRACQDFAVRRRRECLGCERRFTTYEKIESLLKVVKKDGLREPFDREKVKRGIEKACYKRPVPDEEVERILTTVEMDVYETFEVEVPAGFIGERVMQALKQVDQIAYVRFASVYREFTDVREFVQELQPMLRGPHNWPTVTSH